MSGIITPMVNVARDLFGGRDTEISMRAAIEPRLGLASPAELYAALEDLYYNDGEVYQHLQGYEGVRGFRNPARAIVEFYVSVVFSGALNEALPLEISEDMPTRDALRDRILDVWMESNWEERMQLYTRQAAMLGDAYLQAAVRTNSEGDPVAPYIALIHPGHVTNFDTDVRGYLTYIRLDIPRTRGTATEPEDYLRTEEWNKFTGTFRRWESPLNTPRTAIRDLVGLVAEDDMHKVYGIDFVPIAHAKFIDDGQPRGLSAPMGALLKSAEASRMAQETHIKLWRYNQPDLQVVGVIRDADGYVIEGPSDIDWGEPTERDIGGYQKVVSPPAGKRLEPVGGNVNYSAHLEAIDRMMEHLQETDAPELAYYQRNDSGQISGRALRTMLIPAIKSAERARGNLERALIRATQMALTLGQVNDLPGYGVTDIGEFERGGGPFQFAIAKRDVMPLSEEERAEIAYKRAQANALRQQYMHNRGLLALDGLTEDEMNEIERNMLGSAATFEDVERGTQFDRGFTG